MVGKMDFKKEKPRMAYRISSDTNNEFPITPVASRESGCELRIQACHGN